MIARKEDLIAALQAIEGNPVIVIEKDGGEYWGTFYEFPQVEVEQVHPSHPQVLVGHHGDTSGKTKFVPLEDDQNRYLVLK
jgi:hypothetical protein